MKNFWFRLPLRTRLGIVSTLLLGVAALSLFFWTYDPIHNKPFTAAIRLAPILFLLWLAWTDLRNIPRWFWFSVPPILFFCLIKPAARLVVIPVALFVLFIMPKR